MSRVQRFCFFPELFLVLIGLSACDSGLPRLSSSSDEEAPSASGPKLGVTAYEVKIYEKPSFDSEVIGWVRGGSTLARGRSLLPASASCRGWYRVAPKGYLCAEQGITTDLNHPTLKNLAQQPVRDGSMPFSYGILKEAASGFELPPGNSEQLRAVSEHSKGSSFALVGSWRSQADDGLVRHFAMLPHGEFLRADQLEPAPLMKALGQQLSPKKQRLALVKGVHAQNYRGVGGALIAESRLKEHEAVWLNGHSKKLAGKEYLQTTDAKWIEKEDLNVSDNAPTLANLSENERWISIDTERSILRLMEGKRGIWLAPINGNPRAFGDKSESIIRLAGLTASVTLSTQLDDRREIYDAPFLLQGDHGLMIYGAVGAESFGQYSQAKAFALSPEDASYLWRQLVSTELPPDWHGVRLAKPVRVLFFSNSL